MNYMNIRILHLILPLFLGSSIMIVMMPAHVFAQTSDTTSSSLSTGNVTNNTMLLEELINEKGKITSQTILNVEGTAIQSTFSANGTTKDSIDIRDTGTYRTTLISPGILYVEGQGVITTKAGETAAWAGQGAGQTTGEGNIISHGYLTYSTSSTGKLGSLNNMIGIFKSQVDEDGNTLLKVWK